MMKTIFAAVFILLITGNADAATKCVVLSADTTTVLYAVSCGETTNPTPTSIDDSDARWITFVAMQSAKLTGDGRQQSYAIKLNEGVAITCAADSAINDSYAIDVDAQAQLNGIYFSLKAGDPFPNGSMSAFPYPNLALNNAHAFSAAEFKALAVAIKTYLYQLSQWIKTGSSLPSPTIALPSPC